ncbi:hypothetical protein D9758_016502 [Tetrapyrgos nigripes]|uniref:F-box domain-containing protein n=1 Tax=Tetrapyrgos nigripes TaxID=182062 RepID=A0A8H5CKC4_9AGAR|nr:hypothetical protein D9758_016502 [Tetrapyrgos nigripes]
MKDPQGPLPPDVIGIVMDYMPRRTPSDLVPVIQLSNMCRDWRLVAVTTPSLWTNIRVPIKACSLQERNNYHSVAWTILSRSGCLPIDLLIEGDGGLYADDVKSTVEALGLEMENFYDRKDLYDTIIDRAAEFIEFLLLFSEGYTAPQEEQAKSLDFKSRFKSLALRVPLCVAYRGFSHLKPASYFPILQEISFRTEMRWGGARSGDDHFYLFRKIFRREQQFYFHSKPSLSTSLYPYLPCGQYPYMPVSLPILFTNSPALQSLTLQNKSTPWFSIINHEEFLGFPPWKTLKHLTINEVTTAVQLRAILLECVALETFRATIPYPGSAIDTMEDNLPPAHCLQQLSILRWDIPVHYYCDGGVLFDHLLLPSLTDLGLDGVVRPAGSLIRLREKEQVYLGSRFQLTRLLLYRCIGIVLDELCAFLSECEALEVLALKDVETQGELYDEFEFESEGCRDLWMESSFLGLLRGGLPRLHTLTLRGDLCGEVVEDGYPSRKHAHQQFAEAIQFREKAAHLPNWNRFNLLYNMCYDPKQVWLTPKAEHIYWALVLDGVNINIRYPFRNPISQLHAAEVGDDDFKNEW